LTNKSFSSNQTQNIFCKIFDNLFQPISLLDELYTEWKIPIIKGLSLFAAANQVLEFLCYAVMFYVIIKHDNTEAVKIVKPSVIKQRNQTNAVTLTGQFSCFLIEIWYIVFVGLLAVPKNITYLREWAAMIKTLEFFLLPLIMITTSAPLRNFLILKCKKQ
jgi:hypothetical protein